MRHLHIWRTGPLVAHITAHAQEKKKQPTLLLVAERIFEMQRGKPAPCVVCVVQSSALCAAGSRWRAHSL